MASQERKTIWDKISNPLILLIAGAVLSGILVPYITRQWQDHQKELELKTELVSRISKTVADLVMTAQLIEAKSPIITPQAYHTALREWTESSAIIESQLHAYFPNSIIGQGWNEYSKIMDDSYSLTASNTRDREKRIQGIEDYFSSAPNKVDWQGLGDRSNSSRYQNSWFEMKEQILNRKNELIQNILTSKISTF